MGGSPVSGPLGASWPPLSDGLRAAALPTGGEGSLSDPACPEPSRHGRGWRWGGARAGSQRRGLAPRPHPLRDLKPLSLAGGRRCAGDRRVFKRKKNTGPVWELIRPGRGSWGPWSTFMHPLLTHSSLTLSLLPLWVSATWAVGTDGGAGVGGGETGHWAFRVRQAPREEARGPASGLEGGRAPVGAGDSGRGRGCSSAGDLDPRGLEGAAEEWPPGLQAEVTIAGRRAWPGTSWSPSDGPSVPRP